MLDFVMPKGGRAPGSRRPQVAAFQVVHLRSCSLTYPSFNTPYCRLQWADPALAKGDQTDRQEHSVRCGGQVASAVPWGAEQRLPRVPAGLGGRREAGFPSPSCLWDPALSRSLSSRPVPGW